MTSAFETKTTAAARRVERHFEAEFGQTGGAAWAVETSRRFKKAVS